MALVQKAVSVPDSVETVVKSVVDLIKAIKGGASLSSLIGDLVADVQAVPNIPADLKAAPVAAIRSIALGVIDVVELVIA